MQSTVVIRVTISSSSFLHCFPFISFRPQRTNGVCAKPEGVQRGKGRKEQCRRLKREKRSLELVLEQMLTLALGFIFQAQALVF